MSHTNGPWSIKPGVFNYQIDIMARGNTLATVYGSTGENLCNAQLMAAAPDMYAALQMVMRKGRIDDSESGMNQVAAALNKARGIQQWPK